MSVEFVCNVLQAGSSMEATDTQAPVVLVLMNDTAGSFSNTWFYAQQPAKNYVLATALAAVSTQSQVHVFTDPINTSGGNTQIYNMYIVAQ